MPGASGASSSARPSQAASASGRPSTRSIAVARHAAGPQQHRLAEAGDDGGFDADRRRAAIDDEIDAAAQIGEHVRGRGRRDMAGAVGRRRDHRPAECREDVAAPPRGRGTRTAMLSSPAVASSATGQPAALGSTSVSGPGQNAAASRAASASKRASARAAATIGDVGDQRIEGRPALGRVEPRHGLAVGGVGAEPVDRLGRKRDEAAGREAARRLARSRRRRPSRRVSRAGLSWRRASVPK